MGASHLRRMFRLQSGVNRKSTVTRWIGQVTVGVTTTRFLGRSSHGESLVRSKLPETAGNRYPLRGHGDRIIVDRSKASKGAEKSFLCLHRRILTDQRSGVTNRAARILSSSIALLGGEKRIDSPLSSAQPEKEFSSRRVNHTGRKFIWCRKTVNTLYRKQCMQNLEVVARPYFGGRKRLDRALTSSRLWRHCTNVYSPFRARAKAMNVPHAVAFEDCLWTFIQVNSPSGGDLDDLLDLMRRTPGIPIPIPDCHRCRTDGEYNCAIHNPDKKYIATHSGTPGRKRPSRGGPARRRSNI